jgi:6-pyruvoyl-tetrahydropterin synthase
MNLGKLTQLATDRKAFASLESYIGFSKSFLGYVSQAKNIQAVIVSQNDHQYHFYQYKKDGNFQVTRPFNSTLLLAEDAFSQDAAEFVEILKNLHDIKNGDSQTRRILNTVTYTLQQTLGLALDALPAGESNKARKNAGELFEQLIRVIFNYAGVPCRAGVVQIPVSVRGERLFDMSYQHDLIVEIEQEIKLIGSVKTSSKDRLDKIFIDKFLYSKLTDTAVPHIAVFLNDVQRKKTSREGQYGVSSTFLPGHFKGYAVKLNSLDGVYYCDIRLNMTQDPVLKKHIRPFDHLLLNDIWELLK